MKNIKKILSIFLLLVLIISLSACNNMNNKTEISELSPEKVIEQFFVAFEISDYETMKSYCTESCIDQYFHEDNVFGMISAKEINIEEPEAYEKNKYRVFVDVKMETAETSALYPSAETSFYIILEKLELDSYLIDRFITG